MTMLVHPQPPLLLHLHDTSSSALEAIMFDTPSGQRTRKQAASEHLLASHHPTPVGEDVNRYVFSQYVMCLYSNIFNTYATSLIYAELLSAVLGSIVNEYNAHGITDAALETLLRTYLVETSRPARGREFVNALELVALRLRPEEAYPGIDGLLQVIYAIYDNERPVVTANVPIYRIDLRQIAGYEQPTLVLIPLGWYALSTVDSVQVDNLYWKFVYSLNIPANVRAPGDLSNFLYLLAGLALPLDPIELTAVMRDQLNDDQRTGIPFCNYLAMYLKQRLLGFEYKLSRLANPRRLLLRSLHAFCGIGGTCIGDVTYARYLLVLLRDITAEMTPSPLTDEETEILNFLVGAVDQSTWHPFTRGMRYEASVEAAKVALTKKAAKAKKKKTSDDDDEPVTDPDAPDEGEDGDPEPDDTGAFSGDKPSQEPTSIYGDTSTDPTQTGDDNIDQTGGGQTPAAQPTKTISTLLPLALPSETIDDHLYRLTVLQFVTDMDQVPDLDIPQESLSVLKTWCESWLFLASIDTTKKLMAQLKLTGHLKEFAA